MVLDDEDGPSTTSLPFSASFAPVSSSLPVSNGFPSSGSFPLPSAGSGLGKGVYGITSQLNAVNLTQHSKSKEVEQDSEKDKAAGKPREPERKGTGISIPLFGSGGLATHELGGEAWPLSQNADSSGNVSFAGGPGAFNGAFHIAGAPNGALVSGGANGVMGAERRRGRGDLKPGLRGLREEWRGLLRYEGIAKLDGVWSPVGAQA